MPVYIVEIWVFFTGLCIGSFLNVCIYRLPSTKTISNPPRSQCPACGTSIRFIDNIPVISYLFLLGRCRTCKNPISIRYPIVELISGLFALFTYMKYGATLDSLVFYLFIAALIVITFIDIDHQIIPDVISLPGILVCLGASFIRTRHIGFFKTLPDRTAEALSFIPVPSLTWNALLGILVGGGSLYLVAWGYYLMTRKEGMGGGDIKLLAMIGALLGWEGVFFTIFVGSAAGTAAGILLMASSRLLDTKLRIPFGPFLSIGAIVYIFFGARLIWEYVKFARY